MEKESVGHNYAITGLNSQMICIVCCSTKELSHIYRILNVLSLHGKQEWIVMHSKYYNILYLKLHSFCYAKSSTLSLEAAMKH